LHHLKTKHQMKFRNSTTLFHSESCIFQSAIKKMLILTLWHH